MKDYADLKVMHIELMCVHWRKLFKRAKTQWNYFLLIFFCFLFPIKTQTSRTEQVSSVCESFATGKIDALKTLEALDLNIDDYSIGVNNAAKLFCT